MTITKKTISYTFIFILSASLFAPVFVDVAFAKGGSSSRGDSGYGGSTGGGGNYGGSSAGGSNYGGSTGGNSNYGGSTGGASNYGGSTAGGSNYGGSTAGGSNYGGSTAGGSNYGGSTAGGSDRRDPASPNHERDTVTTIVPAPTTPTVTPPVVTPPTSQAPACSLSLNPTSITSGANSTLSWTSSNATSGSITSGVGSVAPVASGSVSVSATSDTTYTGVFSGAGGTVTCSATLTITASGGGGGSSGGGGGSSGGGGGGPTFDPRITLSLSVPEPQPLSSVYLSQVPYTGLTLGAFGQSIFWSLVTLWSVFLTYLFVGKQILRKLFTVSQKEEIEEVQRESHMQENAVIEEIKLPQVNTNLVFSSEKAPHYKLIEKASLDGVLLSEEGALYIVAQDGDENSLFASIVAEAKARYPREDGWLALNKERIISIIGAEHIAPVAQPLALGATHTFTQAIVSGDEAGAFAAIARMNESELKNEILSVISELDAEFRNRKSGKGSVYTNLSDTKIESMLSALTGSIDATYHDIQTSAKIALSKVFAVG